MSKNTVKIAKVSRKVIESITSGESRIVVESSQKNAGAQSKTYAERAGIKIRTNVCHVLIPTLDETIKAVLVTRTE